MHTTTLPGWTQSCVSGSSKPSLNRSVKCGRPHWLEWVCVFTDAGLNAVTWAIGVCCPWAKHKLTRNATYNKSEATDWEKTTITDFQKSKWFLKRSYAFLPQKNQARSQLAKTGKFPLACGSLTPKKGSLKTSFVYSVSFCQRCYKQSKSKVFGMTAMPTFFCCHSEMCFNTDFPQTIYTYQSLYVTTWNIQNKHDLPPKFVLLVLHKHSPLLSISTLKAILKLRCFHLLKTYSEWLVQILRPNRALHVLMSKQIPLQGISIHVKYITARHYHACHCLVFLPSIILRDTKELASIGPSTHTAAEMVRSELASFSPSFAWHTCL